MPPGAAPPRPALLYDGSCRVCRLYARLLRLVDLEGRVRVAPYQDGGARLLLAGMDDAEVERSAHLVAEDGRVYAGGEAFHQTLRRLAVVGTPYRRVSRRPAVRRLTGRLYDLGVALRDFTECALPNSEA